MSKINMPERHTPDTLVSDLMEWSELPDKITVHGKEVVGRCFLNTAYSDHSGSMKYDMTISKKRRPKSSKVKGFYYSLWGSVELRDCARRIDLTLDGNTKNAEGLQKLENTERKLRKIIVLCERALEAIEKMRSFGNK